MKKIFTFIIMLLCFSVINVYAEPTTWPNSFTYEDYQYQIEGVSLRVYKMERDLNSDEVTSESANNYINEVPVKEIPLSSSSYTINPEYKTAQLNGIDSILVDLNLNITKEQLETFLAEELSNVTATKNYWVEIAVNYKLTQYPQKYQHIYNTNLMRTIGNSLMNQAPAEQDMTKTIHQVFNAAILTYDEGTNTAKLDYENTITENNGVGNFVLNYLGLYENAYSENNTSPSKIFMFYNIDNIDYLVENLSRIESNAEDNSNLENPKTSVTDQKVSVPNTAKGVPNYIYVISISCIVFGLLVIGYTFHKRKRIG